MRKAIKAGMILAVLFTTLGAAATSFAAESKAPEVPKAVFIKTGKMWDSEKGEFVTGRTIKIVGRMITGVSDNMAVPKGSRVIDLSTKTVLPGLIDAHTHLLYLESLSEGLNGPSMDGLKAVIMEGDALRALRGAGRAKTFLDAGITTVQDLGNCGRFGDVALRTAVQEGQVIGPRMRVSGPGLSPVGGQFPKLLPQYKEIVDGEYRVVRSVEDGIQAVRECVNMGVDLIKVYSDSAPNRSLLSVEEMTAIAKEAHGYGLRVTAHCVFDTSIRNAVLAGIDGVDHVYQVTDETLKLIKEKGVVVIPTYQDKESHIKFTMLSGGGTREEAEKTWPQSRQRFADLIQRFMKFGITVASGSDMYIDMKAPQGQAAKRVLYGYAECGMPIKEVLKTTSTNAARHLGLANRIGVIKAGAFADIIAVDGDPEKDIYCLDKVVFVMKDGRIHAE